MSTSSGGAAQDTGIETLAGSEQHIAIASLCDETGNLRVVLVRERLDEATVAEYAEKLERDVVFPAIVVFEDEAGVRRIAEGWHRTAAHVKAERTTILAQLRRGSEREAKLYAVGTNSQHGRARTSGDKHAAVMVLLQDSEWARWNNCEIARRCDVSESFVRTVRNALKSRQTSSSNSHETTSEQRTVRRKGKEVTYTITHPAQGTSVVAVDAATVERCATFLTSVRTAVEQLTAEAKTAAVDRGIPKSAFAACLADLSPQERAMLLQKLYKAQWLLGQVAEGAKEDANAQAKAKTMGGAA